MTGVQTCALPISHGKGKAVVEIGHPGGAMGGTIGVDPVTLRIRSRWGGAEAKGDGYISGTLGYDKEEAAIDAGLLMMTAHQPRSGAGARLLWIWCTLMGGYLIRRWVAEAVGPEGEAFLKAMERRGEITLHGQRGSYWVASCE